MFCSHCGKKVTDTMLFCPFCGDPIVIPEQDEEPAEPDIEVTAPEEAPPEPDPEPVELPEPEPEPAPEPKPTDDAAAELLQWSRERRTLVEDSEPVEAPAEEAFSPLLLDAEETPGEDWREDIARKKEAAAPEKKAPEMKLTEAQAARLDGRAPGLDGDKKDDSQKPGKAHRSANTFVPPKAMNPNDIFMDGKPDAYDDYDAYDEVEPPADDTYAYEEEREGSFFMRHIRGIVALTLLVILAILFFVYTFTADGQRSLARMNLARNKEVYAKLGYDYYQAGQYEEAGKYYERALARDEASYSYASSAANAYVSAKDTEKAAEMLKKCIEIDPSRVEPYVYLLNLYPDAAQRPWDITQLIRQGFQLTGDGRLDIEA